MIEFDLIIYIYRYIFIFLHFDRFSIGFWIILASLTGIATVLV